MPIYIKAVKGILLLDLMSLNTICKSYSDSSYLHATYPKLYSFILWLDVYVGFMDGSCITFYILLEFISMVFFIISVFGIIFF